jgi:hypothetical protein
MTSQSPRIYIYKITFDEVLYYYYGVHKEKKFNEYYVGTPVTHKWCWELYEPKKQILQFFEFNDDGWLEAQEIEKRIIKQFYNKDKWCLNENCGGKFSLKHQKEAAKKSGLSHKQNGTGFFKLTKKERSELSKKCGGIGGNKTKELGVGIFSLTPEEKSTVSKRAGKKVKELGVGIFSRTLEQISEDCKKGGKKTNAQKWECTETGYITNSGALTHYQRARGIDTSKRKRIA